jgi:hypothetical protein
MIVATRVAERSWVAVTRPLRLFTKNTALCKHESGRIGCDACPVLEGQLMGSAARRSS